MQNKFKIIFSVLIFFGLFGLAQGSQAAIITVGPNDCSASAVNSAISSASDGDTVQLACTGSVTWSSTVSIPNTKGVTLQVQNGTNTPKTSSSLPLTVISSQTPAIQMNLGTGHEISRVSGFKFQNSGTAGDTGFINVGGQGTGKTGLGAFRIDNNYLDTISGHAIITVYGNGGPLYGVLDNNTMHNAYRGDDVEYGPYGIQIWNDFTTSGCWGKNGWTNPFNFGDANSVFIEDNLFENVTSGRHMRHYISSELGGRYVVRYNTFNVTAASPGGVQTDAIDAHGYCLASSNGAGARGGEVYHNTFSGSQISRDIMPRGGTWLIYDNTFNNTGAWSFMMLMEYRAGDSSMYGQCSSSSPCSSPWYPHVSDGSHYPLDEQVTGSYMWNNLSGGSNQTPDVDTRGVQSLYIQQNRDFFVSASKPSALAGYSPYTYPNPLRSGGSSGGGDTTPPAAPSGLSVQ